jgi:hypothetical protein
MKGFYISCSPAFSDDLSSSPAGGRMVTFPRCSFSSSHGGKGPHRVAEQTSLVAVMSSGSTAAATSSSALWTAAITWGHLLRPVLNPEHGWVCHQQRASTSASRVASSSISSARHMVVEEAEVAMELWSLEPWGIHGDVHVHHRGRVRNRSLQVV